VIMSPKILPRCDSFKIFQSVHLAKYLHHLLELTDFAITFVTFFFSFSSYLLWIRLLGIVVINSNSNTGMCTYVDHSISVLP
jgi:hypothetical protein